MAADSPAPRPGSAQGGLGYVLGATVVAGGIGYVIQAFVPALTGAEEYVSFSVFWSVVYLVVSALAGVQQELTRASHPGAGDGWRILAAFAAVSAAGVAVIILASSPLWARQVFASDAVGLVGALVVAAVGYTLVACLSGALYGVRNWPGVAAMTISDAALRLVAVGGALLLGAGAIGLGWAVAVPFALAAGLVGAFAGGSIRRSLTLDTDLRGLARNSSRTVGAAIASGIMISGLPFLLGLTSGAPDAVLLASLILVITLTRAPLVIPLLALQSYLLVTFRDSGAHLGRRVILWSGVLLGLTASLAALSVVVGPAVVDFLYGGRYELPPAVYAVIVASAGLTGALCITGPAVLSTGRHTAYLLGWALASVVTIACLLLPLGLLERVSVALLVGPIAGAIAHSVVLMRSGRVSG